MTISLSAVTIKTKVPPSGVPLDNTEIESHAHQASYRSIASCQNTDYSKLNRYENPHDYPHGIIPISHVYKTEILISWHNMASSQNRSKYRKQDNM